MYGSRDSGLYAQSSMSMVKDRDLYGSGMLYASGISVANGSSVTANPPYPYADVTASPRQSQVSFHPSPSRTHALVHAHTHSLPLGTTLARMRFLACSPSFSLSRALSISLSPPPLPRTPCVMRCVMSGTTTSSGAKTRTESETRTLEARHDGTWLGSQANS